VVNPPAAGKYQYWTGGKPVGDIDDWLKSSVEHPGSWWPHWHRWIVEHDGETVPARKTGSKRHKPVENAPGSYVLTKA
jgi:polyhydroxyalkanoate synthase